MASAISEWILKASMFRDPLAETASTVPALHEKINWLLFACALQQGINLASLQKFIAELQKDISSIAELPAPAENLILSKIAKCKLKDWDLACQAAGIAWSVGRFARARKNRLDLWVKGHSPSDIWRSCGEIFYMGKTSAIRPKALGFLLRVRSFAEPAKAAGVVPLPNSAGATRWMIQEKIYNAEESPGEKLRTANSLYKELYPKNPSLACHALQFFTEPLEKGYFCQKFFSCNLCPIASHCK
ncbi:MAG: hypothetical protein LBH25_12255 [Fibromonadaceae bacterium]|jgi:hypothetical protein|nr:hypothetical protein [Fibromonadaceae bacterium]